MVYAISVPGRLWPRLTGTGRRPWPGEALNLECGFRQARFLHAASTTHKPRASTLPERSTRYEGHSFPGAGGHQDVGRVVILV